MTENAATRFHRLAIQAVLHSDDYKAVLEQAAVAAAKGDLSFKIYSKDDKGWTGAFTNALESEGFSVCTENYYSFEREREKDPLKRHFHMVYFSHPFRKGEICNCCKHPRDRGA